MDRWSSTVKEGDGKQIPAQPMHLVINHSPYQACHVPVFAGAHLVVFVFCFIYFSH